MVLQFKVSGKKDRGLHGSKGAWSKVEKALACFLTKD